MRHAAVCYGLSGNVHAFTCKGNGVLYYGCLLFLPHDVGNAHSSAVFVNRGKAFFSYNLNGESVQACRNICGNGVVLSYPSIVNDIGRNHVAVNCHFNSHALTVCEFRRTVRVGGEEGLDLQLTCKVFGKGEGLTNVVKSSCPSGVEAVKGDSFIGVNHTLTDEIVGDSIFGFRYGSDNHGGVCLDVHQLCQVVCVVGITAKCGESRILSLAYGLAGKNIAFCVNEGHGVFGGINHGRQNHFSPTSGQGDVAGHGSGEVVCNTVKSPACEGKAFTNGISGLSSHAAFNYALRGNVHAFTCKGDGKGFGSRSSSGFVDDQVANTNSHLPVIVRRGNTFHLGDAYHNGMLTCAGDVCRIIEFSLETIFHDELVYNNAVNQNIKGDGLACFYIKFNKLNAEHTGHVGGEAEFLAFSVKQSSIILQLAGGRHTGVFISIGEHSAELVVCVTEFRHSIQHDGLVFADVKQCICRGEFVEVFVRCGELRICTGQNGFGGNHIALTVYEGDSVFSRINYRRCSGFGPSRGQGDVTDNGSSEVISHAVKSPACEGEAFTNGISGLLSRAAVGYALRGNVHAFTCKGNGVFHYRRGFFIDSNVGQAYGCTVFIGSDAFHCHNGYGESMYAGRNVCTSGVVLSYPSVVDDVSSNNIAVDSHFNGHALAVCKFRRAVRVGGEEGLDLQLTCEIIGKGEGLTHIPKHGCPACKEAVKLNSLVVLDEVGVKEVVFACILALCYGSNNNSDVCFYIDQLGKVVCEVSIATEGRHGSIATVRYGLSGKDVAFTVNEGDGVIFNHFCSPNGSQGDVTGNGSREVISFTAQSPAAKDKAFTGRISGFLSEVAFHYGLRRNIHAFTCKGDSKFSRRRRKFIPKCGNGQVFFNGCGEVISFTVNSPAGKYEAFADRISGLRHGLTFLEAHLREHLTFRDKMNHKAALLIYGSIGSICRVSSGRIKSIAFGIKPAQEYFTRATLIGCLRCCSGLAFFEEVNHDCMAVFTVKTQICAGNDMCIVGGVRIDGSANGKSLTLAAGSGKPTSEFLVVCNSGMQTAYSLAPFHRNHGKHFTFSTVEGNIKGDSFPFRFQGNVAHNGSRGKIESITVLVKPTKEGIAIFFGCGRFGGKAALFYLLGGNAGSPFKGHGKVHCRFSCGGGAFCRCKGTSGHSNHKHKQKHQQ